MRAGDTVEDFELPDETGTTRKLSDFLRDGPVVLFFYPAAMTMGCTKESCHFRPPVDLSGAGGGWPVLTEENRQLLLGEQRPLGDGFSGAGVGSRVGRAPGHRRFHRRDVGLPRLPSRHGVLAAGTPEQQRRE